MYFEKMKSPEDIASIVMREHKNECMKIYHDVLCASLNGGCDFKNSVENAKKAEKEYIDRKGG